METFYIIKTHFLEMRRYYNIDNTNQGLKFLRCAENVKSLSRFSLMVLRSFVVGIVVYLPFIMALIIYPKLFGQGLSPYRLFVTMASFSWPPAIPNLACVTLLAPQKLHITRRSIRSSSTRSPRICDNKTSPNDCFLVHQACTCPEQMARWSRYNL